MLSKRFPRLVKILASAVADAEEIFPLEGRSERFAHFWVLVIRQFTRNRCFVRASALSFSTLLALIPLLAVALSVTSRLLNPQQEASLTEFVEKMAASVAPSVELATNAQPMVFTQPVTNFPAGPGPAPDAASALLLPSVPASNTPPVIARAPNDNVQKQVAQEIHGLVQTASNGTLGATGLVMFILTAVSLLRGIEETFNDMWGVTRGRSWRLQFTLYWAIITLGPLLLATALGFAGGAHLQQTRTFLQTSPFLGPIYAQVVPIAILTFTLGFIYKLTPNTKVELSAAMIGGLVSGTAWHVYNQLGFLLVSRALTASKFYGSLALVVLVMGGLYVLWLILLFGAQIAYAYQNRTAYLQDRLAENVNQRGREFVALRIMACLGQRFQEGQCPVTVSEISTELGVPSRLTQSVLRTLAATRLVAEIAGGEAAFIPARPLDAINAYDILIAMRTGTGQELPLCDAPALAEIYGEFARIEQAERNAAAAVSMLALANHMSLRPKPPPPAPVPPEMTVVTAPEVQMPSTSHAPSAPEPAPPLEKLEPAESPKPVQPPRREPARPDEHTDFPL